MTTQPPENGPGQTWVGGLIRFSILAIVLAVVGWRGRELWNDGRRLGGDVTWQPEWLVAAAIAYLVGWLPSAWFWKSLLARSGHPLGWWPLLRAYYCGHLGKYIPGKASVLVIRAGLLRSSGVPATTAAWTATWETLLAMGVGGILGLGLAPWLVTEEILAALPGPLAPIGRHPLITAGVVATIALAAFPWLTRLVTRLTRRMTRQDTADVSVSTRQVLIGSLAMSGGWICHGLSLWWTLEGLGASPTPDCRGETLAGMTAAVGLATSLGFAAIFAPGGVGVREGVLIEGLSRSGIGLQPAVLGSIVLRATWLLAELIASAALYYGHRPARPSRKDLHH